MLFSLEIWRFHFFETPRNEAAFIFSEGLRTQRFGVLNPRLLSNSGSPLDGKGDNKAIDAIPFFGVAKKQDDKSSWQWLKALSRCQNTCRGFWKSLIRIGLQKGGMLYGYVKVNGKVDSKAITLFGMTQRTRR